METNLAGDWVLLPGCWWVAVVTMSRLFFLFLPPQQSLLRQQERVEERVHEIEEQLCKLDSDKCVVEVGVHLLAPAERRPPRGVRPRDPLSA